MLPVIVIVAALVLLYFYFRVENLSGTLLRVEKLELHVERLTSRIALLETPPGERAPAVQGPPRPVAPAPLRVRPNTVAPPPASVVQPRTSPVRMPASAPRFTSLDEPEKAAPARHVSLEERLGHNWLNKLGIVILVTGLVLLLGYQVRTLGALGKSCLGLALASGILLTGLVLERRDRYQTFARAAIGGGWALLYFVTFGLYHVPAMQVLHSQTLDLVLMLTVAAGMVLHSLRYRSQVVTGLAFLLGFFTVSISHVTGFSLIASAILAAGLVTVAFRQHWFVLQLCGLIAVYANHFLWLQRLLPHGAQHGQAFEQFLPSAALLLFYWLLFRLFYIFRIPENGHERVCATANVLLNSTGLLALLKFQSSHPEWGFRGLLALGVAELILAFIARRRHHAAFVNLACIASTLLLAAVPFHFAGSSWSLAWLLQAELLFVAGLFLRETVFRRLGIVSAFAAAFHLLAAGALPVFELRQLAPDPSHHLALSIGLACAALAAWFNAEVAPRRWPQIIDADLDRAALRGLGYTAVLCAGVAAWTAFAGPWTLLPWLGLAWSLSLAADRWSSADLAQQADGLAFAAIARAAVINFAQWDHFAQSPRVVILLLAAALVYLQMRRKQPAHVLPQPAIAPAYTWAAAALLAMLEWYALQPAAPALAWSVTGLALLELGFATRKSFFRQQGFALLAASFARMAMLTVTLDPAPGKYTLLALAAVFAWAYQRGHAAQQGSRFVRAAGAANAWFALGAVSTLLYLNLRPAWLAIAAATLTVAALSLARVLDRPLFRAQATVLALLTAMRALSYNILSDAPAPSFFESRLNTVVFACMILLAALPIAYGLRRRPMLPTAKPAWFRALLSHPEQVLFFVSLALLAALIPVQLRAGMITIGWCALGLAAFLFALPLKERSFRLSGLGLLLLGVAKVLTVDVWHASPIDRYITLIVMGAALLLVSFLYSRYRESILNLL